ncbi:uncharacterized protein [Malus domestica]|uniref:uncharacterized protein n=1 Tax=Malus domestica TaxID=3750 RepID=UPI003974D147
MFVQPQTSPFSHTLSQIRQNPSTTSETSPPPSLPISTSILHLHTFHTTPIHYPQALPCPYTIHNPFYITKTPQKSSSPNLPQGEEKETVHENCLALQSELLNNFRYKCMTRSSKSVQANILEFDDDFERTLRRTRRQQASNPPSPEPHCEENEFEEEEEPTARVVEENQEMAADNRTIKELSASGLDNAAPLCIQYPAAAQGKTEEFELKSSLLHHVPKYHGLSMEDPNKHLKEFEVVCSSMTPVNVDGNILKMKAFPFSLMDKAKDWLYELAPGTVTSWESMKRAFLEKFFPTSRVILLRKRISGIQQSQGESFPTYYERFKTLVASCPQHQMKEELLLQYFYEGLLPMECQMLDASAGGALVDMTPVAAKTLIANRAHNAQQYESVGQRDTPRSHHVNEGLQTQAKEVNELKKQMGQMAEFLGQIRDNGKLPSTTVVNPKGGFESAKAITLRSGKEVGSKAHESAQNKEEEPSHPTARVVPPMPQPPKPSHPSTSEKIGTDHSAPNTKVASRAMQDEGIGVEHKDPTATALKIPNVAENTMRKKVHVAATSSQHQGKAPSPNPIPIKVDSWFPSLVQVVEEIPLHAVGSNGA